MQFTEEMEHSLLLKRHIRIVGIINQPLQESVSGMIFYLNALSSDPVTLLIDSDGGNVNSELTLVDVIANSRAPVQGIVIGWAASAAFCILQSCHERLAYEHARLRFHAPSFSQIRIDDSAELKRNLEELQPLYEEQFKRFSARSGQSEAAWRAWAKAEKKFNAREALALGIIDRIVTLESRPT